MYIICWNESDIKIIILCQQTKIPHVEQNAVKTIFKATPFFKIYLIYADGPIFGYEEQQEYSIKKWEFSLVSNLGEAHKNPLSLYYNIFSILRSTIYRQSQSFNPDMLALDAEQG